MILVAGGTGSLGSRIVEQLLERGDTVRVLARRTSDYLPLERKGAEMAFGDLKDVASLERACAGVDVVITTATMSKRADDSVANVDLNGNQNLITAAEHMAVEHFIFVSTNGAVVGHPLPLFDAKARAEERLRDSDMVHTVLRPDAFMDVWFGMLVEAALFNGQPVTLVGAATARHSFIAENDVAAFAVASVRNPAARNATLEIGGPSAINFRDVVQAYEAALGRAVETRFVAPGAPIPGLPESVWGIAAALESYESVVPMDERARQFAVSLTPVAAFARGRVQAMQLMPRPR